MSGPRLAELSREEKARLFERLRARQGTPTALAANASIPRLAIRPDPLPLSFAQQRLWFLDRLQPGDPSYNVPAVLEIAGSLRPAALGRALEELADRHEALRTTFTGIAGIAELAEIAEWPAQVVAQSLAVPLPLVDLTALPEPARGAETERLVREEVLRPFDLAAGPLLRALLLRLETERHVAVLNLHHIVCDGWSLGVLVREMAALYEGAAAGTPAALAPLPIQYADFAVWQRQWLQGERLDEQLAFWRQRLAGIEPLSLPTDRPRPPRRGSAGGARLLTIGAADAKRLQALSLVERATPFIVLLAAFQALLGRLAGQEDLVVGSPVANRTRSETAGLIGFFVNTLVLRGDLSGDPTFRELVDRLREVALAAYAHQDLPFERLVEELRLQRDPSRTPLFQALFVLQNAPSPPLAAAGLAIRALDSPPATAKFDLSLGLAELGDGRGLCGALEHSAELFDGTTAARFVRAFEILLGAALASPDRRLSDLSLLATGERHQLVVEWNPAPAAAESVREPIHRRFEAQVDLAPSAPAVTAGGETLTYGELDARANRLARQLLASGVRPGNLVGLRFERSAELVVAILAVLKAGASYLPLDPSYPAERLAFALEDSGAALLLTRETLDAAAHAIAAQSSERPQAPADPELPAYVIYTSGSTGRPKGVVIPHGHVTRLFTATRTWFGFGPADVWTLFHSYAFDFSVWEIWGALFHGGRLVVVPHGQTRAPEAFYTLLRDERVTVLNQTPSAFRQLLWAETAVLAGASADLALRLVILGGEALEPAALAPWIDRHGDERPRLVNMYGITETTVHVTYRPLRQADVACGSVLGVPIPDLTVHVVDRGLSPQLLGVPGEIAVGGQGVARGYLGRPELTAERFVPDPFGPPGARLYRSGDLARRLPDGELEYLGRVDSQVKVRGYRVELGEIEAALARHPAVREAVVGTRPGPAGEVRLVAWLAAGPASDPQTVPSLPELRAFLASTLPDPMLPSALVVLDRLPLTRNGKVDRRALPEPEAAPRKLAFEPPATGLERLVASLFGGVLELPAGRFVGRHEDFFALGGSSLTGAVLVNRLQKALGEAVPVAVIFEASTPATLAARLEERSPQAAARLGGPAALLGPGDQPSGATPGPAPLSFPQERLWFLDRLTPGTATYNIPGPLALRGPLDVAALTRGFDEIRRRHAVLRTRFAEQGGTGVQIVDPWHPRLLPVVDLAALPKPWRLNEAGRLTEEESAWPFDLGRGPLLRTLLLRLAGEEHVLLQTVHHIVSDGWSVRVMQKELTTLYGAFVAGLPSPLLGLPVQYTDFARWQRQWLTEEETARQIGYWRERLGDDPPPLDLPLDRPRPLLQTFRGGSVRRQLPADLADGLRRLAAGERGSLFMALLAGFDLLLSRLSGQDDVLVGTPVAGRVHADLEGLIGCFLNTLVLRADLAGNPTFRELLVRVRDAAVGAYAHQEIPFERLLAELKPERDLSRPPLFHVLFNLLSFPDFGTRLPGGLTVEPLAGAEADSKFDLTIYATEIAEGISLDLVYNADLFDAPRMEEMLRQYTAVLAQAMADPETLLDRFSLLTPEATALLPDPTVALGEEWVGGVHELFAKQARRHPRRPAVEDDDGIWTYGELAAAVSRLAAELRAAGVERGDRVAIWAHRSAPLALAVLGVLEAGAAFVMLDPAYPAPRIVDMLDLARPRASIALALAGPMPAEVEGFLDASGVACRMIVPAQGHQGQKGQPGDPGQPGAQGDEETLGIGADDLAYVAFTSGSTGRPKGILGRHGPLTHFLPFMRERFGLGEGDRFSVLSGLAHDPLQRDLFTPLCLGGTVCVPSPGEIGTPGRLAAWMARRGITVANLTPAMGQILTEPPGGGAALATVPTLRWAMLVGDVLTRQDVDRIRCVAPRAAIVNLYGSTETVRALGYHVAAETPSVAGRARQVLPLGRGMEDVQLLVLRAGSGPAALAGIGEVGELCVRSPHLAAGYLGDPELTRERFQINPMTSRPGDRIYRTGDLGRYLPDGEAAFAGRRDQQVQIRGFRVELGDIEAALGRLPGVREAVVVAREDEPGDRRLVAYVVPDHPVRSMEIHELREALRATLPAYMVPAAFVILKGLPLTPNNKVDRRALPKVESPGADRLLEPATPTERLLAQIWAAVLKVERVGRHDDFFALGGHSLLATQVVARIRDAFRIELPLLAVFQEPTLKAMADRVDGAMAMATTGKALPAIAPRRHERSAAEPLVFPLSLSQRGLWFLDQLEPASPTYVMATALRLTGRLDPAALGAALGEVVRRHESLRTTFRVVAGEPVQVIAPAQALTCLALLSADLSCLPPDVREAEVLRLGAAEARRPFDLARGPLLRATLLQLREREHVVLVALHHIVSDAWSLGVLVGEVSVLYAAFAAGRPSPLAGLPLQFPDYAEWQRDQLQGEALSQQLAYWTQHLAGAPSLDLPADRPRRAIQRPRVAQLPLSAPPGLAERLQSVAQGHGATPFMVLLAAFEILLARYTGQDDLVVGVPVANRRFSDLEQLIGLFVNTLALRGDLSGDPAFSQLLARVRETTLAAWAHQDLPLERLVAALRPERDLSREPLFQVLFQVQNAPPPEIALAADLALARVPLGTPQAGDYEMVISLVETPEGLAGEWVYNTDLFDRATIERMAGHFFHLLAAACADPAQRLSELTLVSEEEWDQLLAWGRRAALPEIPEGSELRRLFEVHAERTPGHPALAWEGGRLSYGELNARANRWAWFLRSRGVGPEIRVALAVERSPEMVVGLLAVLKAGGAWVPLDPAWPVERLAFMVEDSGALLLLTQRHLAEQIAGIVTCPPGVFLLDGDPDPTAGWSEEDPAGGTGPEQAAYVIYTSGSTGRPKGVVAINAGLSAFARSMADILRAVPADRYLQFPSFSFDASLVSIASTLVSGATLVLHPRVTELSAPELQAFCASQGVTLVDLPPAFIREIVGQLTASGKPERLFSDAPVRALDTGGESLSRETLQQWARLTLGEGGRGGDTLFLNSYGPTEATVTATIYAVTAREANRMERATIPLGRPLPGVEVYLLDGALCPVPLGVAGDLYVGGSGLTRGYLHRPDLTAGAFLPDPLSDRPGARLYHTGDRARWLPDSILEFLGRRDAQVKIRGFRVELGEIESALIRHPAVAQAVVVLDGDRLVAYVVPTSEVAGDLTPILRDHLRASLPDPLVPAAFVYMDRLPRTPGGKLDRRNLPPPETARPAARDLVPPRDSVEQSIADLWQRLLGLEAVGVHDNFFELGGHSLLGTRVIASLLEEFGVEVPLRALFEKPTIAALALAVAQARVEQSAASEVDALLDSLEDISDEEVEALLASQDGGGDPPA